MIRLPLPTLAQLQATVPVELLGLPHWLPWVARPRSGGGTGKVPCLPRGTTLYPVNCLDAGLPHGEAHALAERHGAAGVGFVLQPSAQLGVLDLDGPLGGAARALLDAVPGYAEASPSGQGVHVWLAGALPHTRYQGAELLGRGFVTVTAAPLPGRPRQLGSAQDVLNTLADRRAAGPARAVAAFQSDDAEVLARLFSARNGPRARRLHAGDWSAYASCSEADLALTRMLRFYTQCPAQLERLMRSSALHRPKWDAHGSYLTRTVHHALELGGPTSIPRRSR